MFIIGFMVTLGPVEPIIPGAPGSPGAPGAPGNPGCPASPGCPTSPGGPERPSIPGKPVGPAKRKKTIHYLNCFAKSWFLLNLITVKDEVIFTWRSGRSWRSRLSWFTLHESCEYVKELRLESFNLAGGIQ